MQTITPEILECYKTEFSCQYAQLAEKYTDYLFIGEEKCSDKKLLDLVTANALLDSLCMLKLDSELLNTCVEGVFENITEDIIFQEAIGSSLTLTNTNFMAIDNVYKISITGEISSNYNTFGLINSIPELQFRATILLRSLGDYVLNINNTNVFDFLTEEDTYTLEFVINNCNKTVNYKLIVAGELLYEDTTSFLILSTIVSGTFIVFDLSNYQNEIDKINYIKKAETSSIYKHTLNCFSEKDFNTLIETIKLKLEGCSC